MAKGGKAIIVVGGTGTGKSTFNKNLVKEVHPEALYIFDPNREYTEYYNKPFLPIQKFVAGATALEDRFIVYEEASMVFSNRGYDSEVVEQLVRKRHARNTFILVFHSLRAVPKYLFDYCNFLYLFKTNDPDRIAETFQHDELIAAFKEIKAAPWNQVEGTDIKYSPNKRVTLLG